MVIRKRAEHRHMDTVEHEDSVNAWRRAREERLRAPTGWLSLIARIPLDQGDNELPFGVLSLRDGVGYLRAQAGRPVLHRGQAIGEAQLRFDEDGPSEALEFEGRRYETARRGDAFSLRVKDPAAPARVGFPGLSYF